MKLGGMLAAAAVAAAVWAAPSAAEAAVDRACVQSAIPEGRTATYGELYRQRGFDGAETPISNEEAEAILRRCGVSRDDRVTAFGVLAGVFLTEAAAYALEKDFGVEAVRLRRLWDELPEDADVAFRKLAASKMSDDSESGDAARAAAARMAAQLGLSGPKAADHVYFYLLGMMTLELASGRRTI